MVKRFLDWRFIEDATDRLVSNIQKSEIKLEAVYGLPRGGLIPAVILSHKLKIPYVVLGKDSEHYDTILIVDDICDSGKTLEKYKDFEGNIYTATIHYKNSAVYEPHFWYKLASENDWLVYPWETADSEMIQDYKNKSHGD